MTPPAHRLVFGFMSGTSMDGVDGAAVRIEGRGLSMKVEFLGHASAPFDGLKELLRALAQGNDRDASGAKDAACALAELHADVAAALRHEHGDPDVACAHGQTLHHAPPRSWQLFDAAPLVSAIACPVVFDLRSADLAAGGQGAPITPLADWIMFRSDSESRAIVNLGGFCNITFLGAGEGPEAIGARDACACNQLLDDIARRVLDAPYDEGGQAALSGEVVSSAAGRLEHQLRNQIQAGRSLGTGDEMTGWTDDFIERLAPHDLAASAAAAIGHAIGACLGDVDHAYVAGGGAHHQALVNAIKHESEAPVERIETLGVPAQAREAAAMAVLGALCADDVPITLPQVTGCASPAPVAGEWMRPPSMDDAMA